MYTIQINSYPQHNQLTFMLIEPSKGIYKVGEKYILQEFSNKNLIGYKYIVSKQTIPITSLTDGQTYLAKNCNKKLFYSILRNQYKTRLTKEKLNALPIEIRADYKVNQLYSFINKETMVDVLVLADESVIHSLMQVKIKDYAFDDEWLTKKLTSDRSLLSKGYCFPDYYNKEKQRPYTEEELIHLQLKPSKK